MTKNELLQYAINRSTELKGLIYNFNLINDKVHILFAAVAGDETQPNICIRFHGTSANERVPSEAEINQALVEYINANGRKNFDISMVYDTNQFTRINHELTTFASTEDEVDMTPWDSAKQLYL
jgi:hypothetical protein